MTPELICKHCRFGTPAIGSSDRTLCHRRCSSSTVMYNYWCAEGEWKTYDKWTSWYDIMDMEEAVTKELNHRSAEMAFPEAADRAREGYVMVRQDCWNEDGYHTISYADVNAQDWTYLTEKEVPIRDKKWGEHEE